jgi:hypothetical protein
VHRIESANNDAMLWMVFVGCGASRLVVHRIRCGIIVDDLSSLAWACSSHAYDRHSNYIIAVAFAIEFGFPGGE